MSNPGTYRITVTADDIQRGEQYSPWSCPIARAVRRTLHVRFVSVGCNIRLYGRIPARVINIPEKVDKFISRFDADRKSVKPFTFTLRVPKQVIL